MVVKSSKPSADLLTEFVRVAHRIVWCTLATVDRLERPRSRVVHPYWEQAEGEVTGWAFVRPATPKVAHLTRRPHVSCSYWDLTHEIAVAECDAAIADDEATRLKVWNLFSSTDEPLGFDPRIMGGEDHRDEKITVLRMTPWRLNTARGAWQRTP
jgi:hypothetical protein